MKTGCMPIVSKTDLIIPPHEAEVLENLAKGMSPEEAVKAAGYGQKMSTANCKTLANHLWKKHMDANQTMLEALHRKGVTPDRIAGKVSDLLDAETAVRTKEGVMMVPDNRVQLSAVDMVNKLAGTYAPKATINAEFHFESILDELEEE